MVQEIITIIEQVGFPIAMCLYMVYVNDKNNKHNNETLKSMTDIINNNTSALVRLTERIEKIEELYSKLIQK